MMIRTGAYFAGSIVVASAAALALGSYVGDIHRELPAATPQGGQSATPYSISASLPRPVSKTGKTNVVSLEQNRDLQWPVSMTLVDDPKTGSEQISDGNRGPVAGKRSRSALTGELPETVATPEAVQEGEAPREQIAADGDAAVPELKQAMWFAPTLAATLATRNSDTRALAEIGAPAAVSTSADSSSPKSDKPKPADLSGDEPKSAELPNPVAELVGKLPETAATPEAIHEGEALLDKISAYGDAAVSDLSRKVLFSPNLATREWAARALAEIGTVNAMEAFMDSILQERDEQKRHNMSRYLLALDNKESLSVLVHALSYVQDEGVLTDVRSAFARLATADAVRQLAAEYARKDTTDAQRDILLTVFPGIRNPQAIPALADILQDSEDTLLQDQAALALARIGEKDAVVVLADSIEARGVTDPANAWVRSIEQVQNKESFAYLIELFEDTSISAALRHGVAVALANAGEEGRRYGLEMLQAEGKRE